MDKVLQKSSYKTEEALFAAIGFERSELLPSLTA